MTKETKTIRITRGQEDHSLIECIYEPNLFFGSLYARARSCTEEILRVNSQIVNTWSENQSYCGSVPCEKGTMLSYAAARSKTKAEYNAHSHLCNVIAFCAERGQGKTSAMLSYATALSNIKLCGEINWTKKRELFWNSPQYGTQDKIRVDQYQYEVLQSIDPTEMEPEDSILKVVLSQMYVRFQTVYEREYENYTHCSPPLSRGREEEACSLQEEFLNCFHLADLLNAMDHKSAPKNAEDELEFISEIGAGMNLRTMLCELLDKYLSFVTRNKETSFLVIPIDDADLNIARVYSILEDIRKYLQLPRIIVLLAANIIQLESIVEQHFLKEYEVSLRHSQGKVNVARCHHIAESYLEKVLPGTHRLYLPNLQDEVRNTSNCLRIEYIVPATSSEKTGESEINLLSDSYTAELDKERSKKWTYQEQLLYFMHKKTGLLFLPAEDALCPVLPENMRELMHLLAFLNKMPDVGADYTDVYRWFMEEDDANTRNRWLNNLRQFQRYLVDIWAASNLRTEGRKLLDELDCYAQQSLNRYLLQFLPGYYAQDAANNSFELDAMETNRKRFLKECQKYGIYLDDDDCIYNGSSYADVCAVLGVLEELSRGTRQKKFVYVIQLYYAIYLHRLLLESLNIRSEDYNPYFFSDFLQDGFLKVKDNDLTLPFGLWRIEISAKVVKALYKNEPETQQMNAILNTWFRYKIEAGKGYYVQSLSKIYQKNALASGSSPVDSDKEDVWIFHPFYHLLAKMDALTCFYKEKDPKDKENLTCPEMFLSFVILLNPCVQHSIQDILKKEKFPSVTKSFSQLFSPLYQNEQMKSLWDILWNVNGLDAQFRIDKAQVAISDKLEEFLNSLAPLLYSKAFYPFGKQRISELLLKIREETQEDPFRQLCEDYKKDWEYIKTALQTENCLTEDIEKEIENRVKALNDLSVNNKAGVDRYRKDAEELLKNIGIAYGEDESDPEPVTPAATQKASAVSDANPAPAPISASAVDPVSRAISEWFEKRIQDMTNNLVSEILNNAFEKPRVPSPAKEQASPAEEQPSPEAEKDPSPTGETQ